MTSKTRFVLAGIICIVAPWIYALIAMRLNPNAGNDGGVLELATQLSVVTLPLGIILTLIGVLRKKS